MPTCFQSQGEFDDLSPRETGSAAEGNEEPSLSEILERAERAVDVETPDGDAPKPEEVELPAPADVEIPEEVEKPVEKALDDGLY